MQMLPRLARRLALVVFLACTVQSGEAATVEEAAAAAFAKFNEALVSRDGAVAARYVDARTEEFYERVRRAALTMPKRQLLKQPLFFQAEVLATRARFGKSELERSEGRDVFTKLAAAGAAGAPNVFESLTLAKIQATKSGGSATAYVSLAGRPDTVPLRVFTEGGGWKIDLTRLLEAQTLELQKKIGVKPHARNASVQSAIEKELLPLIAKRSAQPVSELWTPLARMNN